MCTLSLNIESGFETRREGGSRAVERASMERVEKGEARKRTCRTVVPLESSHNLAVWSELAVFIFSRRRQSVSLSVTHPEKKKNPREREGGDRDAPETR